MEAIKAITLDLLSSGVPRGLEAVQNDSMSRAVELHLHAGGQAFAVPDDAIITLRYRKPDGTAGWYDSLPDGGAAIKVEAHIVTVTLVDQVLTVPGRVAAQLELTTPGGRSIATFAFYIEVAASVLSDAEIISSDYYNVLTAKVADAAASAASASRAAQEAKQAASSVNPQELMHKTDYAQPNQPGVVRKSAQAGNADKLGNLLPGDFADAESVKVFTATFRHTAWTDQHNGTWTQTVDCDGMQAACDIGTIWIKKTGVQSTDTELQDAVDVLNRGYMKTLDDGKLSATLYETPPTSDVQIFMGKGGGAGG